MLLGVPSIFIRTSGCNLRCVWCDTPYASWKPEGEELSIETILQRIHAYDCRHVVLTGGEPMLAKELPQLALELKAREYHITIETAGTLLPNGIICDLASLSPKLSNSTPEQQIAGVWTSRHEQQRYSPHVLRVWKESMEYQLKFVVTSAEDLEEIESILTTIGPLECHRVFLMPEGTETAVLQERSHWLAPICLKKNYRFAPRLQIELYGHTRGT